MICRIVGVLSLFFFSYLSAGEEKKPLPKVLYKILSMDNWDKSREEGRVVLPAEDGPFVHLAARDQLENILDKHWKGVNEFVILKINTSKLKGKLIEENNHYHLYNGSIPLNSLVEVKFVNRSYKSQLFPKGF